MHENPSDYPQRETEESFYPEVGDTKKFAKKVLERAEKEPSKKIVTVLKKLIKNEIDFLLWCKNHEEFFYLFKDNRKTIPKGSPLKKLSSEDIKQLYEVIYEKDMDASPVRKFFNRL